MRKQVFATIGCAIFLLIVVGFLMMAYSSYTKHQEEIAEQKLIKQERKESRKTLQSSEEREWNLDCLWEHVIEIDGTEIEVPIKYNDLIKTLGNKVKEAKDKKIMLQNGQVLWLNCTKDEKDSMNNGKDKAMVYGISIQQDAKDSCVTIQKIKTGMSYDKLKEYYETPVTKDDSQSISVLQYADPKSDLDITQQNVTVYLDNNTVVGLGIYYDGSKEE